MSEKHDVHVIDACVKRLGVDRTLELIRGIGPQVVLSLSSVISLEEDISFFRQLKKMLPCKLIVSGDIYYFEGKSLMEKYPVIDAVLLDYNSSRTLDYIEGDFGNVKDMIYRDSRNGIVVSEMSAERTYRFPVPRYDLFPMGLYSFPFARYAPFASVSTNIGCPFACEYCSLSKVHFRERDIKNVLEELDYLKSKGYKELFVRDSTFSVNKSRTKELLREMVRAEYGFVWSCDTRIDCVDEELLGLMKQAGCHTIMFGVESGSDKILKERRKNINKEDIRKVFDWCGKLKIQTMAHFILGFPEDTEKTIKETIRFARELKCDFVSFNTFVPRLGTAIRGELNETRVTEMDSSKSEVSCCAVPLDRLLKLKREGILCFYFRPLHILKIMRGIKTVLQLKMVVKNALALLIRSK